MPPWEFWVWALALLASLAGLAVLLLALLHVRYRAEWRGEWTGDLSFPRDGNVRIEFGFPGFMRAWDWPAPSPLPAPDGGGSTKTNVPDFPAARAESAATHRVESVSPAQETFSRKGSYEQPARPTYTVPHQGEEDAEPRPEKDHANVVNETDEAKSQNEKVAVGQKDPQRLRKALFRLVTDSSAWVHLIRYGFRVLRLTHSLLRPRVRLAAGHPDPALLGRLAGHWHAVSPLLPLGDTTMNFRFQDRRPSLRLNVEGGFSALSLLFFGISVFGVFPFFGIGRRAWRGWRQQGLTGWRAWAYRRIQSL